MEKKTVLSESTFVPVSFLVTLLLFSAWLTSVWANGLKNTEHIVEIKQDSKEDMHFIRQELKEMRAEVKEINSKLDKR